MEPGRVRVWRQRLRWEPPAALKKGQTSFHIMQQEKERQKLTKTGKYKWLFFLLSTLHNSILKTRKNNPGATSLRPRTAAPLKHPNYYVRLQMSHLFPRI